MISIRPVSICDSDVIVVGAGPAGASAARHLARAGLRVVLLDWQTFPRDKVCGDFVGPAALRELHKLEITSLPEYRQTNVIREAALYLNGKKLIERSIPQVEGLPSVARAIPRLTLDAWIVDAARAAGAEVWEGWRAVAFQREAEGLTLTVEGPTGVRRLRTQLLIGADGSNSTIARLLRGHQPPKDDRIIALRAYFEGVEGPADRAELYFTDESFPGYYWLFPTSYDTANVGIGMLQETLPRSNQQLRELLLKLIKTDAALQSRLSKARLVGPIIGWPLTTYHPSLPIVSDRIMLIGDAAGLINPLNGEGIQYSLLSSRWAAETVRACAKQQDFSERALRVYAQRVEEELRYDMALASLIVQAIRNRSFNPIWLHALRIIIGRARIDPDYAHIAGGILAGLVPSSEAISLKIIGGTLEQGAVTLTIRMIQAALFGPGDLLKAGAESLRTGYDIAHDAVQNPLDFLRWSLGLAGSLTELVSQVSVHLLKPSQKAVPEQAPTVRLLTN